MKDHSSHPLVSSHSTAKVISEGHLKMIRKTMLLTQSVTPLFPGCKIFISSTLTCNIMQVVELWNQITHMHTDAYTHINMKSQEYTTLLALLQFMFGASDIQVMLPSVSATSLSSNCELFPTCFQNLLLRSKQLKQRAAGAISPQRCCQVVS